MRRNYNPRISEGMMELAVLREEGVLTGDEPLRLSAMDAVHIILDEVREYQTGERRRKERYNSSE